MTLNERIKTEDGFWLPRYMSMPCGGLAEFDYGAGHGYRCLDCMAVIGSMGQPKSCVDEQQKYSNWAALGGKDWEYFPK